MSDELTINQPSKLVSSSAGEVSDLILTDEPAKGRKKSAGKLAKATKQTLATVKDAGDVEQTATQNETEQNDIEQTFGDIVAETKQHAQTTYRQSAIDLIAIQNQAMDEIEPEVQMIREFGQAQILARITRSNLPIDRVKAKYGMN